jgi:hypothetical protein
MAGPFFHLNVLCVCSIRKIQPLDTTNKHMNESTFRATYNQVGFNISF